MERGEVQQDERSPFAASKPPLSHFFEDLSDDLAHRASGMGEILHRDGNEHIIAIHGLASLVILVSQ